MLLEGNVETITTSGVFEEAGNVATGFMTMTGNFISGLWANPIGKIVIALSFVGGAIGLGYKLFLRRKHI